MILPATLVTRVNDLIATVNEMLQRGLPMLRVLSLLFLSGLIVLSAEARENISGERALFEPADGKTMLFIGQEKSEIADYWNKVGSAAGYMLYTNLSTLQGMDSSYKGKGCSDSGYMSYPDWLENYPDTAVQIGLYMVGQLPDVVNGDLDVLIEDMAEMLRQSGRPVFLRPGYEFDGPWNRYGAPLYKQAFQRMVRIFRGEQLEGMPSGIEPVTNVAFVWHSAAYNRHQNLSLDAWYPGDEYVDWIALSWFHWGNENDLVAAAKARNEVAEFARVHGKPLMIAEAAPKRYFQADQDNAWRGWFGPVFDWIEANNVKAYSYINQDWTTMPQWRDALCGNGVDWGDTRIQRAGTKVLKPWLQTMNSSRFLLQGKETLKAIGFSSR